MSIAINRSTQHGRSLHIDLTAYPTPLLHRERWLECRGLRGLLPLPPGCNMVLMSRQTSTPRHQLFPTYQNPWSKSKWNYIPSSFSGLHRSFSGRVGPEIETLPSNPAVLQPRLLLLDSVSTGGPKKTVSGKNIPIKVITWVWGNVPSCWGKLEGGPSSTCRRAWKRRIVAYYWHTCSCCL